LSSCGSRYPLWTPCILGQTIVALGLIAAVIGQEHG